MNSIKEIAQEMLKWMRKGSRGFNITNITMHRRTKQKEFMNLKKRVYRMVQSQKRREKCNRVIISKSANVYVCVWPCMCTGACTYPCRNRWMLVYHLTCYLQKHCLCPLRQALSLVGSSSTNQTRGQKDLGIKWSPNILSVLLVL